MKEYIKKIIKRYVIHDLQRPIVKNINLDLTKKQKHILVCYLDLNAINKELLKSVQASNRLEAFQIIRILIKMDFIVDVCAGNDESVLDVISIDDYDYVLGSGCIYRKFADNSRAVCILYMTENPYGISYLRARERLDYFNLRNHTNIKKMSRTGCWYWEGDERLADYIICLGEEKYFDNLEKPVYRLFPSALKNENYVYSMENRNRNCFLVFGAIGLIHKGVDILIEVFRKHSEWKLFLCGGSIESELKELKLQISPNIILCGFVEVGSEKFMNLVSVCSFVILPSCSEASTTGVLTGMRHGLLPMVCRGNGFERCSDYCLFFEDFHIEAVEERIMKAINMSDADYIRMGQKIFEYANDEFSIENYSNNLETILRKIFATSEF